jgi:hypothetical protein
MLKKSRQGNSRLTKLGTFCTSRKNTSNHLIT